MSNFLFIDGAALIKVWFMGYFIFHTDGVIHILPVIATFAIIAGVLSKRYGTKQWQF
jgi:hypothetical protein